MTDLAIIRQPWLTEKSTELNKLGKYVFRVQAKATKSEIKKAIQKMYKVDVADVNLLRGPAKQKGFRHLRGHLPAIHKAVVTLKPGQKIDLK